MDEADETVRVVQGRHLFNQSHRLLLGIVVLFSVDVIWVASSELSEHIFHNEKFDKPFYSTYVKTSMFLIFLVGFACWSPWQKERNLIISKTNNSQQYTLLTEGGAEINTAEDDNELSTSLSPSAYIPVNYQVEAVGGATSSSSSDESGGRSVHFSKLAEVRMMSEKEAGEALLSRMSYQASIQAEEMAYRLANRLNPADTARLALTFCILWFIANYTYQLGLSHTEVGIVNVLSSSSSLFTLFLAALFPSVQADKITLSKLLCVLVSLSGVAIVSLTDLQMEHGNGAVPLGAIFALISALFYAAYLVFLRKKVDHEDRLDIPLFFGFVGLFNLLILWPLFFILNYAGVETFEWPTKRQWLFLVVNGIIGTVFSEVLWLWGCFLTSSLIATLAISLTIPMSMIADVLFKNVSYSYIFYIGSIPMLFSFFFVTILCHYNNWDPLLEFFERIFSSGEYRRVLVNNPDESLLDDNNEQREEDEEEEEQ